MKKTSVLIFLVLACLPPVLFSGEKINLAVLHFTNNSGKHDLNYLQEAIPEMLITNLAASPKIRVLERTRIKHLLEEQKLSLSGVIDEQTAVQIGSLIGADILLYGSIFVSDTQMRIDSRATSAKDGTILLGTKAESDISEGMDIIGLIDDLSVKIVAGLTNEQINIKPLEDFLPFTSVSGRAVAAAVMLDNAYKLRNSTDPSYMLVSLRAGKVESSFSRIPLNICMVMDKSGSMEGEDKLENVKQAALFVVDNLNAGDYFSLVTYDTHVYTPIVADVVRNKEKMKRVIREITSGSSTNLSGGMLEGYAQVSSHFKKGYVNRVLLLTDGLANTGITEPVKLKKIAQENNRKAIALSTFGVGVDFNEDLLTMLSEFGGANYHFINNPEEIAAIFSTELQGLLSVVAQNAKLEIALKDGVQLIDVFGYEYDMDNDKVFVQLNDIFSEEEKSILIKFKMLDFSGDTRDICSAKLTYDDVVLSHQRINEDFNVSIKLTGDKKLLEQHRNAMVHENIALYESAKLLDRAMTYIDDRDFEGAEASIDENIRLLKANVNHASSRRLKQQMLNVMKYSDEYKEVEEMDAAEVQEMQKSMKYKNYLQKKKK